MQKSDFLSVAVLIAATLFFSANLIIPQYILQKKGSVGLKPTEPSDYGLLFLHQSLSSLSLWHISEASFRAVSMFEQI